MNFMETHHITGLKAKKIVFVMELPEAAKSIYLSLIHIWNNPNFYLKHNFEKEYSYLGTPYVQENCDIAESDNLVIYGHHIKGGKMFGALEDYKSKSFYEEHKNIQFDTLTEMCIRDSSYRRNAPPSLLTS